MTNEKLFNALKTAYGKGSKLGLDDEAIGRAAALGTAEMSEEQIAAFVAAAEPILKAEQSAADRVRTEYSAKLKGLEGEKAALEAKLNGNNPPEPNPESKPQGIDVDALVDRLNAAWEQKLQPLQEKLNAFETAKTAEQAVKQAQEKFGADEWVNGYPELRDSAWAQAMRIYDRTGKSMTADELHTEAMEIFKPLAKAKGLDISQPFKSDGASGGEAELDMTEVMKIYQKSGRVQGKE